MFRVHTMPAIEHSLKVFTSQRVTSLASAMAIQIAVAEVLLYLGDSGAMRDYSNSIFIEQMVNGEWVEVDD